MGLKFIVSEAQERSSQAIKANNQAQEAAASLQQSIQNFLSAPLSSDTYDSAKNYFLVVYTPICQSITMTGEAFANAHKKFLSEYQSTVSGVDMDEDKMLAEIKGYEDLLHAFDELIRTAKTPKPDLEKRATNAYQAMQKRQEKLDKFRDYSARSASFFSEYESSQQELNTALAQVNSCKAWNASTGTFDIKRLDMNWAKPISNRWKEYQDNKRGIDSDKNKELKKYTLIRCYDEINDQTTWSIEHNGKRLDDPALQAYLKKVGKYLSDKDYTILSLTPKEWETRINNQWKQGTEYFNGGKVPWVFQGLGHIQDYVQKRQYDGTWDAMWSLGFTFANVQNAINGGNKLKVSPNAKDHLSTSEGLVRKGGKGVVGAHNMDAFYNEIQTSGFSIDDCIIVKKPHPSLKGIYEIEYQIPAIDNKGNVIPNLYKKMSRPKTVYDPKYFSDNDIYKMGLNALEYGAVNGRYVYGTAPNGLRFTGFLDKTGTLTNFFPTMK